MVISVSDDGLLVNFQRNSSMAGNKDESIVLSNAWKTEYEQICGIMDFEGMMSEH